MPARNAASSCARSVPLMQAASQPWRLPGNEGNTTPFRGVFILPNGRARCLDRTMTVVALVVRAGLRTRWRSWLALALVAGLVGGLVTAVAAGARRTDAAYPGLIAWSKPPDDLIALAGGGDVRQRARCGGREAAAGDRGGAADHLHRARARLRLRLAPATPRSRRPLAPEAAGRPAARSRRGGAGRHLLHRRPGRSTWAWARHCAWCCSGRTASRCRSPSRSSGSTRRQRSSRRSTAPDRRGLGDAGLHPRQRRAVPRDAGHRPAAAPRGRRRARRGACAHPAVRRQGGQRLPARPAGGQHRALDPPAGDRAVAARRGARAARPAYSRSAARRLTAVESAGLRRAAVARDEPGAAHRRRAGPRGADRRRRRA